MRKFATLLTAIVATTLQGSEPWRLHLVNDDEGINLKIDLYAESITVPTMEMFGPMNGYLNGKGVYGVWTVTSFRIADERTATLRLSNDLGSETQSLRLTQQSDSTYQMELEGSVVVKRSVNRKLVKIPAKMQLSVEATPRR